MKQLFLPILTALLALVTTASAQQEAVRITGSLTDRVNREPLPNAAVALLASKDSAVLFTTVADGKGAFTFKGTPPGRYVLSVTYLGYTPLTRNLHVTDTTRLLALGTLALLRKGVNLQEVEIVEAKPPITIKEDTIEFNAGSFKVRENALVEDLLKKLPGIQVEKDGTIKANGETVKRVLVDGKPFFGDDPKMSTRNLPADVIDKIQLIDRKSDQAQFTGIPDGETEKALNLTIKPDRKKGMFGRASAGYGSDSRFSVSGNANRFRNTQQLAVVASGNNVNNTGFGGSGGRGMMMNNANSEGLMRNWIGGINYSDNLAKGLRLSSSYFLNDLQRENEKRVEGETRLSADSSRFTNNINGSLNGTTNHRLNARMEYDIDSFHSLIVTPNVSWNTGNTYSENQNTTLMNKDTLNTGRSLTRSSNSTPNLSGSALFRKKFDKKGRTFSTNLTFGAGGSDVESVNQSRTAYYKQNAVSEVDSIDQKVTQRNRSNNLGVRMSYTEPLLNDRYLELNYGYNYNFSSSDRRTFNRSKPGEGYDELDDSLTNSFSNVYSNHQAGLSLMTQRLRYHYTLGMNVQFNSLNSENLTKGSEIRQSTVNVSPLAHFNYNFSAKKRLRASYRGQTKQPTLEQLQPVPDNSNPLFIKEGNPDLRPSFSNNVNISYNAYNQESMRSFFAAMNGSFVLNQIVNATSLTDDGRQVTRPVNVNGNYNFSAFVVNGFSMNQRQDRRTAINTNTNLTYSREISFLNGQQNFTNNFNITQGANFNYSHGELFDISAGGSVNYNRARFSVDKRNNTDYFNFGLSLDFNVNLPLGFIIGADVDYTANTGRSEGYNLQYTLMNGFVSKSLFSKKQGLLRFQVYDLLNQNVSVNRTVSGNYIEDVESKVLRQYFMLSFSYFLNSFGGKATRVVGGMPPPPPAM
ncbi:TonB-dependent receptor [Chitinophaga sp.]|uniref:TonB-dependent receptor n=1 Tax=Chitinophaga sp. TaxID=1869181 RepID=UPI0031D7D81B